MSAYLEDGLLKLRGGVVISFPPPSLPHQVGEEWMYLFPPRSRGGLGRGVKKMLFSLHPLRLGESPKPIPQ
jgi:hypothetical protein